jgi:serine/threonine-protein kinase
MPLDSSSNQEQAILYQARTLPPAERAAFLNRACGQDEELRRRIEARLKAEAIWLPLNNADQAAGPGGTLILANGQAPTRGGRAALRVPPPGLDKPHAERFLPGAKIGGRYRIVSLAGKGGMGEVYRADDLKLGHPVALKFLPPGLDEHSPLLQYFLSEVRLSRQIAHPNVCRVYDIGEVDGQQFLSMEYIDGEDLRSLLRRIGRLPQDKGIQIAQQLCAGLAAAHEKGVLHRDLKPANIMIDGEGRARITDFGLARLEQAGAAGELVGTPLYMAPEQLARGETTVQTDLYSLGLVLFEMFTGQPAHAANSIPELLRAHERPPQLAANLVSDLNPAVERALLRCLENDPRQRPRSARALAAALPGGDALAAALAAGETPSPEMVAAAGGEGILKTAVGLACLATLAAGLVLACGLAQSTYRVNRAGLDKHPEALAADARRIIESLGYRAKAADSAFGFADEAEDSLHFFYRQSPQPLIVFDFYTGYNELSYGHVVELNPHWAVSGELGLKLSPRGELLAFRAVPPLIPQRPSDDREPDWTKWFPRESLGFDLGAMEKISNKVLRPPDAYDHLQVWRGFGPQTNEFYVEAAAYNGRPVYFEILAPWRFKPGSGGAPAETMMSWMFLVVTAGAAVLAWRNFRLRRSDRQGAFRVALYFFCLGLLITAIHAHHTLRGAEGGVVEMALAQAASRAIVFWLWYTALEPYVRRLWPQTLISWTRLLEGRWRDSLVGRDLLLGCLFGLALNLAHQAHLLAPKWLGGVMHEFQTSPAWTLAGTAGLFADFLFKQLDAVFFAMFFLMSLLLLRFALRKMAFASLAFLTLFTTLSVLRAESPTIIDWAAGALGIMIIFCSLVQSGFLASVVALLCSDLLTFPLTLNFSAWYAAHGLAGIAIVAAIALFGFLNSRPRLLKS